MQNSAIPPYDSMASAGMIFAFIVKGTINNLGMGNARKAHPSGGMLSIEAGDFHHFFTALHEQGYTIMGPSIEGGSIVCRTLTTADELPAGWGDEQSPGMYRLKKREDGALFGFTVPPQSWKSVLHPPETRLWRSRKNGNGFEFIAEEEKAPKLAFLGVRPCDLQAIRILDRVFTSGNYSDGGYRARRDPLFIIAVNCTEPGGTCFCASMGTGPRAGEGFDIALTEIAGADRHYFLAEAGSRRGDDLLAAIPHAASAEQERREADRRLQEASARMGRTVDTSDVELLLARGVNHPRWEITGRRCLTCTNCTMVCPTCFCTTVEDTTDLSGHFAERRRKWDSCFTLDFSYIHGGSVRPSAMARYRQWLTHKFSSWFKQFGSSGCVGCGRCITWCPVGIDVTEEIAAIRTNPATQITTSKGREQPV